MFFIDWSGDCKKESKSTPPPRKKKHITLDSNLLHLRYSLYTSASLITHFTLKRDKNMLYWVTIHWFFALMLLVFTMRRMVRSAHLTRSGGGGICVVVVA